MGITRALSSSGGERPSMQTSRSEGSLIGGQWPSQSASLQLTMSTSGSPVCTPALPGWGPGGVLQGAAIVSHRLRADDAGRTYTAYVIKVTSHHGRYWIVERRYSEFRALHEALGPRVAGLARAPFPRRRLLFNYTQRTITLRRSCFDDYLRACVDAAGHAPELQEFLEVGRHYTREQLLGQGVPEQRVSIRDFDLVKVIGQGSFGRVYLVRRVGVAAAGHNDSNEDTVYAMKVLKKSELSRRNQVEHTHTERRILAHLSHPFIVSLKFAFQSAEKLYLVTDYCQGGELFFHMKRLRTFPVDLMRFYVCELTLALEYLHSKDVIYRDMKPENILLDAGGHVKLADFGLSKEGVRDGVSTRTFCGTPEYLAPEMLLNRTHHTGYTQSVDWWSLGVVAFEMVTGWPPFYDRCFDRMCAKIMRKPLRFNPRSRLPPAAQGLLRGLLDKNPAKRLGCTGTRSGADVRAHHFFAGVDWGAVLRREAQPPYRPRSDRKVEDVKNFDAAFTRLEPLQETPSDRAAGFHFAGFSFVHHSEMHEDECVDTDTDTTHSPLRENQSDSEDSGSWAVGVDQGHPEAWEVPQHGHGKARAKAEGVAA